jgi:hypothetical protein
MTIRCISLRAYQKNRLKGFADLELTCAGSILHDRTWHRHDDGKEWVGFPAKSYTDKNGEINWQSLIEFSREQFRKQALEAIHAVADEEAGNPLGDRCTGCAIEACRSEANSDGRDKPTLHFERAGPKPLLLNKTNAKNIAAAYGADTSGWIGRVKGILPKDMRDVTVPAYAEALRPDQGTQHRRLCHRGQRRETARAAGPLAPEMNEFRPKLRERWLLQTAIASLRQR